MHSPSPATVDSSGSNHAPPSDRRSASSSPRPPPPSSFRWLDGAAVGLLLGCGVWLWWRGRRSLPASAQPSSAARHASAASNSGGGPQSDSGRDGQRQPQQREGAVRDGQQQSGLPLLSSLSFESWSAFELSRLQTTAEWTELRRVRAVKAADEWQRRQAGKQASYGRWSRMREVGSQQRWRQQMEAEQAAGQQSEQQAERGGSHYWHWYDDGEQQQRGPQFVWQRNQSQSVGLPASVVQAGDTLGLPELARTAPLAAAASAAPPSVWSVAEIKAAFKRRALQTHPDMPNGDQQAFQAIAKAYDTLITFVYDEQSKAE